MKFRGQFPFFSLMLLLVGPVWVLAQAIDCPSIVEIALAATDEFCAATGRNQACYGNVNLEVEAQVGTGDLQFSEPGDLVNVAQVKRLRLSPLDEQQQSWGVVLMRIQANVPDTLPGQNVTFLLFGDVEIENAGKSNIQPMTLEVMASRAVVVYERPSDTSSILAGIIANEKMIVDGQSSDNLWLRVRLPDDASKYGWIDKNNVTGENINQLPVIDFEPESIQEIGESFRPMQAFYFKTGLHDRPCSQAPDSGILIQAPEAAGPIELRVNDVDITLGSTAYLQAQPSGEMTISVIEGAALVEANGETRAVPAGTQVRVPMNENLAVSGQPSQTEPYDTNSLEILPVQHLDNLVEVASALTADEIVAASVPIAGHWFQTSTALVFCEDGSTRIETWEGNYTINSVNENSFVANNDTQFNRVETSFEYTADRNVPSLNRVSHDQYYVLSPTHIIANIVSINPDCTWNISRELKLVDANGI